MPIHSVFFIGIESRRLLYSRYFDDSQLLSCDSRYGFESSVQLHTGQYWPNLDNESGTPAFLCLDSTIVLSFCVIGKIVLYVNGTEDMDEATLPEALQALRKVVMDLVEVEKVEEDHLMENSVVYAKMAMAVDEMFPMGTVEQLDAGTVLAMIKLKSG